MLRIDSRSKSKRPSDLKTWRFQSATSPPSSGRWKWNGRVFKEFSIVLNDRKIRKAPADCSRDLQRGDCHRLCSLCNPRFVMPPLVAGIHAWLDRVQPCRCIPATAAQAILLGGCREVVCDRGEDRYQRAADGVLTTVRIETPMPAAIRPYSIAVTPDSSFAKRFRRLLLLVFLCWFLWLIDLGTAGAVLARCHSGPHATLTKGRYGQVNYVDSNRYVLDIHRPFAFYD